jgi:type II secretory pathway component PulK
MNKLETLLVLLGTLCVAIAVFFGIASALNSDLASKKLMRTSSWYFAAGALMLVAHGVLYIYPEWRKTRRTEKLRRNNYHSRVFNDPRKPPAKNGGALLWALLALTLLTASLTWTLSNLRVSQKLAAARLTHFELRQAAGDAALTALKKIADDEDLRFDGAEEFVKYGGESVTPGGTTVRVRVLDENRSFDVNNLIVASLPPPARAPADVFEDLLSAGADYATSARRNALIDWTDPDDEGFHEAASYRKDRLPYTPSNRLLLDWPEWAAVRGFSRKDLDRERTPDFSSKPFSWTQVFSMIPELRRVPVPVNINTALPLVLRGILGPANEQATEMIAAMREIKPFRSLDGLAALLNPLALESIRPYLSTASDTYRIEVRAFREETAFQLQALARRDAQGAVRVVRWIW